MTTPPEIRRWSRSVRADGRTVGLVPTMGALHAGHLALVATLAEQVDEIVVSIFVNPLQFNQPSDFDQYPRPIDDDLATCERIGAAAVYAPTAATMYPPGFQTHVEPGELAERLEGSMRPGHFRGVTTVVGKLICAVEPDVAAFGQKDYQQLAIVRRMVADLDMAIEVVGVPIVREPDGLALSSRNVRLGREDRAAAVVLSQALSSGRSAWRSGECRAAAIRERVVSMIEAEPRASLEYVAVVDAATLRDLDVVEGPAVILTAAWFGDVRLIDNMLLDD